MQRHPLEDPSLAPYGFAFPLSRERLNFTPTRQGVINPERIIAGVWENWNRMSAGSPVPIETIIHEIMPAQATANRFYTGDFMFNGLPYLRRDIALLSSIVQWFATSCGNAFLFDTPFKVHRSRHYHPEREFVMKLNAEREARSGTGFDLVLHLVHVCDKRCRPSNATFGLDPHHRDPNPVLPRDRAVADACMRWLGKQQGRAFIDAYRTTRGRKEEAVRSKTREEVLSRLRAQKEFA